MAGECAMENAVGMAAMVKADRLQMQVIARELSARLQTEVVVGGVEANMAIAGALTTPGCAAPLAILDLGAGSTDAAIVNAEGQITAVHLAGAGNMVSLLIKTELGLEDLFAGGSDKKIPLAKVESLFSIRHENGAVEFFREALSPAVFAKVVYIKEGELVPIDNASPLEKIRLVRRQAKEKVFVTNCLRALRQVSPGVPFAISPLWCWWAAHRWTLRSRSLSRKPCRTMAWSPGRAIFGEQKGRAMRSPPGCYWPVRRIKRALAPASLFNVLFQDADNEPDFYLTGQCVAEFLAPDCSFSSARAASLRCGSPGPALVSGRSVLSGALASPWPST
ncbi:glycerol dehydratase reactivation factor large subunit [Klebsiella pneumoniae]|uniref:Glycerol dehydratase reactivation factor large subunit n=1 Tax=Klebsiella pneumoniae TaxID=573 RepID=A0A378FVA8_KLEPN|nr:glycerol dehydratase reactivation factor large subunit [Klebsiella pneumoniae]